MDTLTKMFPSIVNGFKKIVIVLPLEKYIQFDEIAKPISENLKKHHPAKSVSTLVETVDDLVKIFKQQLNGMSSYMNRDALHIILGAEIIPFMPPYHVIYQFEQLVAKHDLEQKGLLDKRVLDDYYIQLRNAMQVWDYARNNVLFLKNNVGIVDVEYVPFQFADCMVYPKMEKDIDIVWIGNTALRRIPILSKIHQDLDLHNKKCKEEGKPILTFMLGNNNIWNNDDPRAGALTNYKSEIVTRSKKALNIHIHEPVVSSLETVRIMYLLANGCKVISEPSGDPETDKEFEDMGVVFVDFHSVHLNHL